jgi:hypothetical protein
MLARVSVTVSITGGIRDIIPHANSQCILLGLNKSNPQGIPPVTGVITKDWFSIIDSHGNEVTVDCEVALAGVEAVAKAKGKPLLEYIKEIIDKDPDGNIEEAKEINAGNEEQPSSVPTV